MYIHAYSNNDIAFVKWGYDAKIKDCLGFCVERIDQATKKSTILPAWVGFENQKNEKWQPKDTSIWPVQKFNWRDFTAVRGRSYSYRVTPMIGTEDHLLPTTDKSLIQVSNVVTLSPGSGPIKAYFNRGIVASQSVSHQIEGPNHRPSSGKLMKAIETPGNTLRNNLMGQSKEALLNIVNLVKTQGGECYAALYELNDPELLEALLGLGKKLHIVLSNADANGDGKPASPDSSRSKLHSSDVDISDRILGNGHIGHNKFLVYVDKSGKPKKILSGSTNWTYTGLCAQVNNAILIESDELAAHYLDYWNRLKEAGDQQAAEFRTTNDKVKNFNLDIPGNPTAIDQWFSPNTKQQTKPANNPVTPGDMKEVFGLMNAAKKSIQFLAFQPGSPSIMTEAVKIQQANPKLYIRGAATDANAVNTYNTTLLNNNKAKPDEVFAITAVAASNITDQFAYWEEELLKSSPFAHAIIHDKIVVIDAYGDDPVVITGSHNLGFKASYSNDENMLIIKGNRALAEAYSVHVMDIYDHYRWRYLLQTTPDIKDAFHGLKLTDGWQDYYYKGGNQTNQGGSTPKPAGATKKSTPPQKVVRKKAAKKATRTKPVAKKAAKKSAKKKPGTKKATKK